MLHGGFNPERTAWRAVPRGHLALGIQHSAFSQTPRG